MVDSSVMRKTPTVPEIKPLDQYNFNRAKIRASLGWLVSKSYGTEENVPVELHEPFYCDQYEQEHIKPPVTRLLLSSELYSRASSQLMGGHAGSQVPPRDHGVLLQFLTKKGVAPRDQDVLVTEADLKHKPIKMSAHLAVIDSLMAVGAMATVSEVKMPDAVEHLGGGAGWENALLYWINRLNQKLRENTEEEPVQRSQQPSTELQPVHPSCPTRWYWKLVPHAIAFCLKESGNKPPVVTYRRASPTDIPPAPAPGAGGTETHIHTCTRVSPFHLAFFLPSFKTLSALSQAGMLYWLGFPQKYRQDRGRHRQTDSGRGTRGRQTAGGGHVSDRQQEVDTCQTDSRRWTRGRQTAGVGHVSDRKLEVDTWQTDSGSRTRGRQTDSGSRTRGRQTDSGR